MNSASLRLVEGAGFEPACAKKLIQKNRTKALDLSAILPCGAHPTPVTKNFLTLIIWCVVLGGGLEPPLHFADLFCYRLSGHYHYTIRDVWGCPSPTIKQQLLTKNEERANLLYVYASLCVSHDNALRNLRMLHRTSHTPLHTLRLCHIQNGEAF